MAIDTNALIKSIKEKEIFFRNNKFNKSQNIFKVIESVNTDLVAVDAVSGVIAIENINENPQELDKILQQYEINPQIANILNLVKTDFNVGVIFGLNDDASNVADITISICEQDTFTKIIKQFAEFGAGCQVEVEWDSVGDEDVMNLKLIQEQVDDSMIEEAFTAEITPDFMFDADPDETEEDLVITIEEDVEPENDDDDDDEEEEDVEPEDEDDDEDDEDEDDDEDDEDK